MESKICTQSNIEKHIENFNRKFRECKDCNGERSLKGYYGDKDKKSNQREVDYEENRDKLFQKQNDRCIHFKELLRSYVDQENRLKVME